MQKIVVDTSVLVSAMLTKGYPSQIIYGLVLSKKVMLCLSSSIWEEYVDVLFREKFAKYPSFVTAIPNAKDYSNILNCVSNKFCHTWIHIRSENILIKK